jgi:hypothetical protein
MTRLRACLALAGALVLAANAMAFAQGTTTISGTVTDSAGGVIPGAAVVVTNAAGTTFEVVTNAQGIFNVPAVTAGAYTVTVTLAGFKTATTDVRVQPGLPASVAIRLEVGDITESITVRSSSELVNTQTATVAATLNSDEITRMPTPTRNALNAVAFLPGVNTTSSNRNSSINGLPDSMVQITLDGVSNNDNFLRSTDGFFASVYPRQDAVEAVTVVMAVGGSQVGGSGAVSINFTTRAGSNRFSGTAYEYYRNPDMNTNYFFNEINELAKNDIKLNQYGARVGGPVVIPGVYDGRGKAFYMLHYEQVRFPNSFTRTRTALHPRALDGWFRYEAGDQIREVNVLSLAAANGQIATRDPMVMSLLQKIQSSMQTTGVVNEQSDPLLNQYVFQSPGRLFEHQPTLRMDYNLGDRHRLSGTYAVLWAERDPDYLNGIDARFPGAPNYRLFTSKRPLSSVSMRSTLSGNAVNELKFGITAKGGSSSFGAMSSNGPQTFEDQGGYAIDFDANIGLTNWWATNSPSWRSVPTYSIDNSLTWQRGKHSLALGAGYLLSTGWENAQQMVPAINLGFSTQFDPAAGLFTAGTAGNFPNASSAQLTDARELYALLTGRVSSISTQFALDANTNQYVQLGPRTRAGKIQVYSAFAQDTWRLSPTLTFTGGLRWDVQLPFTPTNDIMSRVTMEDMCGISGMGDGGRYSRCNFFSPGASGGVIPEFKQLTRGTLGYETDWNNFAPTLGLAWRPNAQTGVLRTLLGDPEQATIRGGYSVAYERHGLSQWTGTFGANPGSIQTVSRTATGAYPLVRPGEQWPVLLSQQERLYIPDFDPNPSFPIAILPNRGNSLNGFAPDVKIGSAHTWNASFQRAISRDMAIEIRYVGTRGRDQWSSLNYNAIRGESLLANGFLDEFKLAMQNLAANNAAGGNRVGSFAYFGPGTGTHPLPTYLAYFNARTDAGNPAAYSGGTNTWASTTFAARMSPANPAPVTSAGDLDGNTTRRNNAVAAGIVANFFVPNPHVNGVNVTDSGAFSDFHALQIEVRRRLSRGLSAFVNYQHAREGGSAFDGFRFGRRMATTTGNAPWHAIKTQWDWTLPVGRGQRYGANMNGLLDGLLGGWSVNAVSRTQQRLVNFGNVRLVGMDKNDLQAMYKFDIRVNPDTGLRTVYMLPADVIQNTRRAFSVSNTTTHGYSASLGVPEGRYIAPANSADCLQIRSGDCAPTELILKAPWFSRVDFGVTKKFGMGGTRNVEVRFDMLNLFDNINFNPVANPGTGATIFTVTSAYTDASNTYDPGGRLGQFMIRFNW